MDNELKYLDYEGLSYFLTKADERYLKVSDEIYVADNVLYIAQTRASVSDGMLTL